MGAVNVADLRVVLIIAFVIALCFVIYKHAYMLGFEDAKRSYKLRYNAHDTYCDGYNTGYTRGVEAERRRQCKN